MKKVIFSLMVLFMGTVFAQTNMPFHNVQIVDERGVNVTTITSVAIYAPDSTTDAVIYSDRGLNNLMEIPVTAISANTTLSNGKLSWYGPDGYNFSITDGTNIATNANHRARTSSEGTLVFPSYIVAISSTTYADNATATWGTNPAFIQSIAAGVMTFTPGADNVNFVIGVSGTSLNSDFNVYVGSSLGLEINAAAPSFTWDGGAVLLNHDYNANVGLCTGTSTGLVSIGGIASGAVAIETGAGITVIADDSYALTVTAGTVGIAATGGDITIDATDQSVIIRGSEAASDAILLDADAGSIDIDSADNITIDAADDIIMDTAGGKINLIADGATAGDILLDAEDTIKFLSTSTAAAAYDVDVTSTGGDMTWDTSDGGMTFTAAGSVEGDVTFVVADKYSVTSTDTAAAGIALVVNGGSSETIYLNSKQGTGSDAISLDADVGGITLLADHSTAGDITLDAEDDIILTCEGALTITNTETATVSGDLTVTGTLTAIGAYVNPFEIVAATNEIEITESGTVFILNDASEFVTTLPTVASAAGVTYRFIVGIDPAGTAFTILTDSLENKIEGVVVVAGTAVAADGPDDTITFTAGAAVVGDWVELTSDGVLWYLSGQAFASTGIVPSQAG